MLGNNVMFAEARKNKDLYLWMSKVPNGPTVKMHVQNSMLTSVTSAPSFLRPCPDKAARSTYHGGAELHRQLSEGVETHPII
jgi:hypothetical protein